MYLIIINDVDWYLLCRGIQKKADEEVLVLTQAKRLCSPQGSVCSGALQRTLGHGSSWGRCSEIALESDAEHLAMRWLFTNASWTHGKHEWVFLDLCCLVVFCFFK